MYFFQDKRERINEESFRDNVDSIMVLAGDAMSQDNMESVLHNTENLLGEMRKMADFIKLQQRNHCDLALKHGILNHNYTVSKQRLAVCSGS